MSNADSGHGLAESRRILFPSRMIFPKVTFEIRLSDKYLGPTYIHIYVI